MKAEHTPFKPRLVSPVDAPMRWGADHLGQIDNERGLREMCDYGAGRFREGYCDLVSFDCLPAEAHKIKDYMATTHPGVAFAIGPAERTLAVAVAAWSGDKEFDVAATGESHG